MGATSYDMGEAAQRLEQRYALDTRKGVHRLLKDIHEIAALPYEKGDFSAIDILLDLNRAIQEADLTYRQRQSIYYYYVKDMEQKDVAAIMGIDESTETRHRQGALKRIAQVFKKWGYMT